MTVTGTEAGAIVANIVLFFIVCVTNKEAFDEKPRFSVAVVGLGLGIFVFAGLAFGPDSFAEAVARNLGGPTVTLLLLWAVRLQRLLKEALRRSGSLMAWILELAADLHDDGRVNAHRYVDDLLSGGVIKHDEATTLHDQLVLVRGIPMPNPNNG